MYICFCLVYSNFNLYGLVKYLPDNNCLKNTIVKNIILAIIGYSEKDENSVYTAKCGNIVQNSQLFFGIDQISVSVILVSNPDNWLSEI